MYVSHNRKARAADEAEPRVVEIIVGPIVHHHGLCIGSVPDVEIKWEQLESPGPVSVADVVFANLLVITR